MKNIVAEIFSLGNVVSSFQGFSFKGIYTFLNPYSCVVFKDKVDFLHQFDGIFLDGSLAAKVFSLGRGEEIDRISFDFTSIATPVFDACVAQNLRTAFVGSTEVDISSFIDVIARDFEGINIVLGRDGFFSDKEEYREFVERLAVLEPDVVVVGMGAPLQEHFLLDLRAAGWNGLGFTCGGFIRQTAKGGGNYYPKLVNALNLRAFYRMYDEPELIFRYLKYYPVFVFWFIKFLLRDGFGRSSRS